jgi:transcriptional accessory protein Tex/SPT6
VPKGAADRTTLTRASGRYMPDKDDLLDREAGEDEEAEEEEVENGSRHGGRQLANGGKGKKKKAKKEKKPKFEDSSEEEDEDDEDDQDEFENDGFIVDGDDGSGDEEEEDEGDASGHAVPSAPARKKKEKRARRDRSDDDDEDELAEGDLLLLEEQGLKMPNKKLRRLRKAAADDADDDDTFRNELHNLANDDDDEGSDFRARDAVDEDVDDVDELEDFIDDGRRGRRQRKNKTGAANSEAVRAARNVFGDFEDIREVYQAPLAVEKAGRRKSADTGNADDGDGSDSDPEYGDRTRSSAAGRGRVRGRDRSESDDEDGDVDDDGDDEGTLGRNDGDDDNEDVGDADPLDSRDGGDELNGNTRRRRRIITPSKEKDVAYLQDDDEVAGTAAAAARLTLGSMPQLTAEDRVIAECDVPEALQVHCGTRGVVTAEEIKMEAKWIYERAFAPDPVYVTTFLPAEVVKKIGIFLTYIHSEKLDIPFIAQYRKDYVGPELLYPCGGDPEEEFANSSLAPQSSYGAGPSPRLARPRGFNSERYDDFDPSFSIDHLRGVVPGYDDKFGDWTSLWTILDWDKKWADLTIRRASVVSMIKASEAKGVATDIVQGSVALASTCQLDVELTDIERYIRLACDAAAAARFREDPAGNDMYEDSERERAARRRRPSGRTNKYLDHCRKGYNLLSEKFGITSFQMAENAEGASEYGEAFRLHIPADAETTPLEMAELVGADLANAAASAAGAASIAGRPLTGDTSVESDPERLLAAARYVLMCEMVAEPRVIALARKMLQLESAMVTSSVTQAGTLAVTESHPLRPVVTIRDKPVRLFINSTEFAQMRKAEAKGYAKLSIRFRPEAENKLENYVISTMVVPVTGTLQEQWNAERVILAKEVAGGLRRHLTAEVQDLLDKSTSICLQTRLMHAASRRLLQGTSRPFEDENGSPRVLSICVTTEEDEEPDPAQDARDAEIAKSAPGGARPYKRPMGARVTFVLLDVNGDYVSSEEVFGHWLRRPAVGERKDPPQEIATRLEAYLSRCKPQMIVIGLGSGGTDAVRLRGDLLDVVAGMAYRRKAVFLLGEDATERLASVSDDNERKNHIRNHIISLPEDIARLHCQTNASNLALPIDGMTMVEKRAIALGRMAQEPLSVYAGIGLEDEVASKLEFHRLHYLASTSSRVEAFRRALIRAVCTNGVDINRLLLVPHMQPMLSFVGGLGRRKASALIRRFEQALTEDSGPLQSRKHLYASGFLGRVVFLSAAGFLRVRDPTLHPGGSTVAAVKHRRRCFERKSRPQSRRRGEEPSMEFFDPLDDSRIHPETYGVAIKIADEALRDENGVLRVDLSEASSVPETGRIIAAVLDTPDGLAQLDLEQYANHLEKLGRGRLYETIKMVATEFQSPFKDYRCPLCTPNPIAEFYLACGADPLELRIGAEITATNCRVAKSGHGISCRLPHGLRGFITISDFSDEDNLDGAAMLKLVSQGSDIPCRVLAFLYDVFEVRLTSKPSVLMDPHKIEGYSLMYDPNDQYIIDYPRNDLRSVSTRLNAAGSGTGVGEMSEQARADARAATLRARAKEVVMHDFYRDVNAATAVEQLRNASPGEVIIRPSGKGKDHFAFTAKFAEPSEVDNDASRGIIHIVCLVRDAMSDEPQYVIGTEHYQSVDEVLERFILPVVNNMGEALRNRKFEAKKEAEVARVVSEAKKAAPKTVPYKFALADKDDGVNKRGPLYLALIYIAGSKTVDTEYIKVLPDGYQLRSVLHTTLDLLAGWFKKNMRKGSAPARSAVARTPVAAGSGNASPFVRAGPSSFVATPMVDEAPPRMVPSAFGPVAGPPPVPVASAAIEAQPYIAQPRSQRGYVAGSQHQPQPPPPPPPRPPPVGAYGHMAPAVLPYGMPPPGPHQAPHSAPPHHGYGVLGVGAGSGGGWGVAPQARVSYPPPGVVPPPPPLQGHGDPTSLVQRQQQLAGVAATHRLVNLLERRA